MKSVLMIGQSNMAGRGFINEVPMICNERIQMLRNGKWQMMTEPINYDRPISGVSLAGSFAAMWCMENKEEQIGLIPCAEGGSSIDDWFVEGAAGIARKLGIPQLIIGLTIVAMGTSMPEAAVSITAALNNNAGITIGNIVGSNILNILIILGITAVITNVAIQKSTLLYEIPFMIGITALLLVFGLTGSSITFIEGVVFLLLFIAFLVYLFIMSKKGEVQEEGEIKDIPVWKCLLFIVIGGVMVVKGSDFAVSGASWIARFFGMSERFIGLTIVAFGTSLPELVTSVAAARKGNAGIAIGNIVGSNIFNILFVIGITALICNVPFESKFLIDTAIAIFSGALLWLGTYKHKELRKPCGIVMLICYAAYFVYLCVL